MAERKCRPRVRADQMEQIEREASMRAVHPNEELERRIRLSFAADAVQDLGEVVRAAAVTLPPPERDQKGRLLPGRAPINPAGRPKGAANLITKSLLRQHRARDLASWRYGSTAVWLAAIGAGKTGAIGIVPPTWLRRTGAQS
jgi:hypothetical protein